MKFPDQNKIHETEKDRINQSAALDCYVNWLKTNGIDVKLEMARELSRYDARLYSGGNYLRIIEVKCRNIPADKYDTYTIDSNKIDRLYYKAQEDKVAASLLVSWQGDVRILNVREQNFPLPKTRFTTTFQKRKDRKEKADKVYVIPISEFGIINLTKQEKGGIN